MEVDVLVHLLHRSDRDMVLVGASASPNKAKYELYLQRRVIDDEDDRILSGRILVVVCDDEDDLMTSLAEQLDHLLESGWHLHDWDPSPISVPAPNDNPVAALDDAMRLFIAASEIEED